ncbi:hypothetical protein EZV62_024366 [Acer yangbiense]|uniref:Uncharacterized protein n=1 Tax=Acer yangbiense TaxID=1000413 RepID=A0A5C7GUS9_9ROSI|nr:hypothetical protein EZV62_024366 [Acer yangbiense]
MDCCSISDGGDSISNRARLHLHDLSEDVETDDEDREATNESMMAIDFSESETHIAWKKTLSLQISSHYLRATSQMEVLHFRLKPPSSRRDSRRDLEGSQFLSFVCVSVANMSADEVASLCEALSLKDREGPLMPLQVDLKKDGEKRMGFRLIGKLLSSKLANRDAFISLFHRIWRTMESFDIEVISEPVGKGDIQSMIFNKATFWIQIHNVPLICMTAEIGRFLEGMIGEVKDIDTGKSGDCVGKYIRVRVVVRIDKPLRCILRVDVMRDGKESVMLLRYEKLPEHCFRCGHLGHTRSAEGGRVGKYYVLPPIARKSLGDILANEVVIQSSPIKVVDHQCPSLFEKNESVAVKSNEELDGLSNAGGKHNNAESSFEVELGAKVQMGLKVGKWKRRARDGGKINYGPEEELLLGKRLVNRKNLMVGKKQKGSSQE